MVTQEGHRVGLRSAIGGTGRACLRDRGGGLDGLRCRRGRGPALAILRPVLDSGLGRRPETTLAVLATGVGSGLGRSPGSAVAIRVVLVRNADADADANIGIGVGRRPEMTLTVLVTAAHPGLGRSPGTAYAIRVVLATTVHSGVGAGTILAVLVALAVLAVPAPDVSVGRRAETALAVLATDLDLPPA
ncbi:hypothetical protein ACFZBU_43790 [Embleya sp. NPDC008237]|uniref:hypothetical protein n=1 Tax=Embleya sp. NPDC008237 TaxID=3363978 RepID=UPI0036EE9020